MPALPPHDPLSSPPTYLVMGVSGSGKTTMGRAIAEMLSLPFHDADDYHPSANVEKMARGIPLSDTDRLPWLEKLVRLIDSNPGGCVLACSALKDQYRRILQQSSHPLRIIFLTADPGLIRQRMEQRGSHFMKADMLHSQLATLEPPADAWLILDVANPPSTLLQEVRSKTVTKP